MPRGFLVGRLFGTNIYCAPGFFLLLGVYFLLSGPQRGATFSIAVILSLLVHEFGHVFAVRWLLKAPSTVVLWGLGGLCIHPPAQRPGHQVAISLMGPAFELVLGGAALAVLILLPAAPGIVDLFLRMMVWINVIWALANLLPVLPLDGGQALRAGLQAVVGQPAAGRITRVVSVVTAGGAMAGAYLLGFPFAALLAALLLVQNLASPGVAQG